MLTGSLSDGSSVGVPDLSVTSAVVSSFSCGNENQFSVKMSHVMKPHFSVLKWHFVLI